VHGVAQRKTNHAGSRVKAIVLLGKGLAATKGEERGGKQCKSVSKNAD
jgi:hypothetical protein